MKALQFTHHGDPIDVLELVDLPEPGSPGEGQALIEVIYAPVNPLDLRWVRGRVAGPALPARIGLEGLARVAEVGPGVAAIAPGDLVMVPQGLRQACSEQLLVSANGLFPLSPTADPVQLSLVSVNPPTAVLLLGNYVDLKPGEWVVQNGGNSAMALNIVAYAKDLGLNVASLVRREEAVAAAEATGADVVAVEGPEGHARIKAAVGDAQIRIGFDGIGGRSTAAVSGLLGYGGSVVAYSAMSGEPGILIPADLIYRDISFHGFFLGNASARQGDKVTQAVRKGIELIEAGKLKVPVGGVYPFEDYRDAVAASGAGEKVFLQFNRL